MKIHSVVLYLAGISIVVLTTSLVHSQSRPYQVKNNKLEFNPYKEDRYVTTVPDKPFILVRYLNQGIDEILKQINLRKDPPYSQKIYELLRNSINSTDRLELWQSKQYQKTLLDSQVGFLMCVCVGVFLALVVPIIGLVLCICRVFCDKCHASYQLPKDEQEGRSCEKCSRKCLTFWLFKCVSLILIGGVLLLLVNCCMGFSADTWQRSLDNGKKDLNTYSRNLEKGYEYASKTQFNSLCDVVFTKNINNTRNTLGKQIQDKLIDMNSKFEEANNTLGALALEVRVLTQKYSDLTLQSHKATHLMEEIKEDLARVSENVNKTFKDCGSICKKSPVELSDFKPPQDSFAWDFLKLDDLVRMETEVGYTVRDSGKQFSQIETDTEAHTVDRKKEIEKLMTDARDNNFRTCFDDIIANVTRLPKLMAINSTDTSQILQHDIYRGHAGYVIAGLLVLIGVLGLLAMCCGICGYDEEATPAQRTGSSHCGGITLLLVTALCFVLFAFLMLVAVAGLAVGGNMSLMLCQDSGLPFVREIVDVPDTVPGYSGYFLPGVVYNKPEVATPTLADTLQLCEKKDESAYEALKYIKITDAWECLDYEALSGEVKAEIMQIEVEIKTDKLLPSSEKTNTITTEYTKLLSDVKGEVESFKSQLERGQVDSYSIAELAFRLRDYADKIDVFGTGVEHQSNTLVLMKTQLDLQQTAKTLDSIDSQYLQELKATRENMLKQMENLISRIDKIEESKLVKSQDGREYNLNSDAVRALVQEATTTLADSFSVLPAETPTGLAVQNFKSTLQGYMDVYEHYLWEELNKNIGHCLPLYNVYRSLHVASCDHLLANYNQFWLFLLISTLFLIPTTFFAWKLSNHYCVLKLGRSSSFDKRYQAEGVPLKTLEVAVEDDTAENPEANGGSNYAEGGTATARQTEEVQFGPAYETLDHSAPSNKKYHPVPTHELASHSPPTNIC